MKIKTKLFKIYSMQQKRSEKFIVIEAYLTKQENAQINNKTYLRKLQKRTNKI